MYTERNVLLKKIISGRQKIALVKPKSTIQNVGTHIGYVKTIILISISTFLIVMLGSVTNHTVQGLFLAPLLFIKEKHHIL